MKDLVKAIELNVREELWRASTKYGILNASEHESYAILKEEYDEAADEMERLKELMESYWLYVKRNDEYAQKEVLKIIYKYSVLAAAEASQTAAMALKALRTVTDDEMDLSSVFVYPRVTNS